MFSPEKAPNEGSPRSHDILGYENQCGPDAFPSTHPDAETCRGQAKTNQGKRA